MFAVKQANNDDLARSRAWTSWPATTTSSCGRSSWAGPGGILVASHLVGPQMREMWDAAKAGDLERARQLDAELRPLYEALGITTNPIPLKAALEMTGLIPSGGLRLPLVPADAEQRKAIEEALDARRRRRCGPRAMSGTLRVLPLGGLGEIGKNMTVVEYDGRIVVVDTGLMFPTAEMLGIDLVLPDFSYLRERAEDIEAIVLTHGHEDHVGALPYVLREIGQPPVIYGGLLTIGMVRSKLDEHKLGDVAADGAAGGGEGEGGAVRDRARPSLALDPRLPVASSSRRRSARC